MSVEIEQHDDGTFLGWQGGEGKVEVLMSIFIVGVALANDSPCLIKALKCPLGSFVIEKCVLRNLEQPRTKASFVVIACRGEICLYQGILGYIVGIILVATALGEQETAECFLLVSNEFYKLLTCHHLCLSQVLFLCLHFLG